MPVVGRESRLPQWYRCAAPKLRLLTLRPWSRIRDERPGCREMDRETDGEKYAAGRSKQVSCTKVSTEGGRSKSDSRIS